MAEDRDILASEFDSDEYLTSLYPVSHYLNHSLPRNLAKITKYQFLRLSEDDQIIQDFRMLPDDQGKEIPPLLLRGDTYIPPSCSIFYFEIKILYAGHMNGTVSIGMCSPESSPNKWLGMENDSFGYRNCSIKSDCTLISHNQFHQTLSESSPKSGRSVSAINLSQTTTATNTSDSTHEYHTSLSHDETSTSDPEQHIELMRLFSNRNSYFNASSRLSALNESNIHLPMPQYTTGDVVGCGVNFVDRSVFFTRNGVILGQISISHKISATSCPVLYPAICLGGENVKISVNFGQEQYSFNIAQYIMNRRVNLHNQALDQKCSKILANLSAKRFVLSYLLHEGHYSVAKAISPNLLTKDPEDEAQERKSSVKANNSEDFFRTTDDPILMSPGSDLTTPLSAPMAFYDEPKWPTIKPPNKKSLSFKERGSYYENDERSESTLPMKLSQQKDFQWPENLNEITRRIMIRQEIMRCNFLPALSLLSVNYPDILRKIPAIAFVLQCRHFISLLVNNKPKQNGYHTPASTNGSRRKSSNVTSQNGNGTHSDPANSNGGLVANADSFDSSPSTDEFTNGITTPDTEDDETSGNDRLNGQKNDKTNNPNFLPVSQQNNGSHNNSQENLSRPKTLQKNPVKHDSQNTLKKPLENGNNHLITSDPQNGNGDHVKNGHSGMNKTSHQNGTNGLTNGHSGLNFNRIIDYGRELMTMAHTLYELKQITSSHIDLLKWAFSMLAYNNVKASPFSSLLLPKHLECLADSINCVILKRYNLSGEPEIKMAVRQLERLTCPALSQNSALTTSAFYLNPSTPNYPNSRESSCDDQTGSGDSEVYRLSVDYLKFPCVPLHSRNQPTDCFEDPFETYANGDQGNLSFGHPYSTGKEKVFSPNLFLNQNSPDTLPPANDSAFDFSNGSEMAGIFHPLLYKLF